jgi:hypothetical protein
VKEGASVCEEAAKKLARSPSSFENGGGSGGIEEGTQATHSGPEVQTNKHTHALVCLQRIAACNLLSECFCEWFMRK